MAQDGPAAGLNVGDFAGYYLAAILVRRLTGVSTVHETENMVRTGNLSAYLLKPLGVIHHIMARTLMERILIAAILIAPVAAGVLAAPGRQFDLQLGSLALFAAACALGFLFEFYAQFAIGGLSFWLVQIYGINAVFVFVKSFLGRVYRAAGADASPAGAGIALAAVSKRRGIAGGDSYRLRATRSDHLRACH